MKRPLMWVCLCLVVAAALKQGIFGRMAESPPEDCPWEDGEQVTITGRVYQKDIHYFYLESVKLFNSQVSDTAYQQEIPLVYHIICEPEEFPSETLQLGSTVMVQGTIRHFSAATNPGEFDAAKYYQILHIGGRLTNARALSKGAEYSRFKEILYGLKVYWRERLYRIFPQKEASIMDTMLLGEKAGLDRDIKELYQRNGMVHILSISGLHITIIGTGIYKLLRRLKAPPALAAGSGCAILLLYGVMTGFGVSSCRAIGMYLIRMAAEIAGRTYDMLTAAAVAAASMVLPNPLYLQHSGFLLSFGSILGIGAVYPILLNEEARKERLWKKRWQDITSGRKEAEGLIGKIADKLCQSIAASLSITITTLPMQLWFYFEVPTYSVILNLLVIPCMAVLVLTGLVSMMAPGLGFIGTVDCLILMGYEKLCGFFEKLPFSMWNPGRPEVWQVALYYMILFGVMGILQMLRRHNSMHGGKESEAVKAGKPRKHQAFCERGIRRGMVLTASVIVLALVLSLDFAQKDTVTFLDVGQGDCICLKTKEGKTYLFDCGSSSRSQIGKYVLKPFLKYHGISHIDGIFLSHPDADHYNGLEELLANREQWGIRVGTLVLSPPDRGKGAEGEWDAEQKQAEIEENSGFDWLRLAAALGRQKVPCIYIYAGDSCELGDITVRCLHPGAGFTAEGNAASQCFLVDFGENTLLLTGDVEKEGEERLLKEMQEQGIQDVTVLKAAHHGSRNSTSQEFLKQASPALTVISCGRNNRYGHPHEELLERLKGVKSRILSTKEQGAVTLEFDKKGVRAYSYLP